MNRAQTLDLLTVITARDGREFGNASVFAWYEDCGDLPFEDATAAVSMHYRENHRWIMPSDIRKGVKAIHDARWTAAGGQAAVDTLIQDIADPTEYRNAKRTVTEAIRAGRTIEPKVVTA